MTEISGHDGNLISSWSYMIYHIWVHYWSKSWDNRGSGRDDEDADKEAFLHVKIGASYPMPVKPRLVQLSTATVMSALLTPYSVEWVFGWLIKAPAKFEIMLSFVKP